MRGKRTGMTVFLLLVVVANGMGGPTSMAQSLEKPKRVVLPARRLHRTSSLTAVRSMRSVDAVIRAPEPVGPLTFSPKGRFLSMRADKNIYLWDFRTHRFRHLPPANQIAFSPSEKYVAIHHYFEDQWGHEANTMRVIDMQTGHVVNKTASADYPYGVAFSPDDGILAWSTGGEKEPRAVHLWNYRTGKRRDLIHWLADVQQRLHKHGTVGSITVLDWHPEGILAYSDFMSQNSDYITICRIDPTRDRVQGAVVQGYMTQNQVLPDGSIILSLGGFYEASMHVPEGVTAAVRLHLHSQTKVSGVFRIKDDLEMGEEGEPGIECARRAMRFVIYGARKLKHRERAPWSIHVWRVEVPSGRKRLVLILRRKFHGDEGHEPGMWAALSPDGRQFAYVPDEHSHHVLVKQLPSP